MTKFLRLSRLGAADRMADVGVGQVIELTGRGM
jgi:hypothetical protein